MEKKVKSEEAVEEAAATKAYWLPDKVYDVLKWVGLVAVPACSWASQTVSSIWDLPYGNEVAMTLAAAGTFIGLLIGASNVKAVIGNGDDE